MENSQLDTLSPYEKLFGSLLDTPKRECVINGVLDLIYPVKYNIPDGGFQKISVPNKQKDDPECVEISDRHSTCINSIGNNYRWGIMETYGKYRKDTDDIDPDPYARGIRLKKDCYGTHINDLEKFLMYRPRYAKFLCYNTGKSKLIEMDDNTYNHIEKNIISTIIYNYNNGKEVIPVIVEYKDLFPVTRVITYYIKNPTKYYGFCKRNFDKALIAHHIGSYEVAIKSIELMGYRDFYYDQILESPRMPMQVFLEEKKDLKLVVDYPIIKDSELSDATYKLMKLMVKSLINGDSSYERTTERCAMFNRALIKSREVYEHFAMSDYKLKGKIKNSVKKWTGPKSFEEPLYDFYHYELPVKYTVIKNEINQDLSKNITCLNEINDINYHPSSRILKSDREKTFCLMKSKNENIKVNNMLLYYMTMYTMFYEKVKDTNMYMVKPKEYGSLLKLAKETSYKHRIDLINGLKSKYEYVEYDGFCNKSIDSYINFLNGDKTFNDKFESCSPSDNESSESD